MASSADPRWNVLNWIDEHTACRNKIGLFNLVQFGKLVTSVETETVFDEFAMFSVLLTDDIGWTKINGDIAVIDDHGDIEPFGGFLRNHIGVTRVVCM